MDEITLWAKTTFEEGDLGEWTMSAVLHKTGEKQMRRFMEWVRPRIVVETGTHHGLSAALMAQYADHVYTFDRFESPHRKRIWDRFGVAHKITYINVEDDLDKALLLDDIVGPFDFAFIDGMHNLGGYAVDFALLQRCGRVLFHDAVPTAAKENFRWKIWEFAHEIPWPNKVYDNPFAYAGKADVAPDMETWNVSAR